ncbi:hypothetical protein H0H93_009283 [Arthromyces matolae]|nr:hypothetical protein H0H93_009283 [Arthromyces matolae]
MFGTADEICCSVAYEGKNRLCGIRNTSYQGNALTAGLLVVTPRIADPIVKITPTDNQDPVILKIDSYFLESCPADDLCCEIIYEGQAELGYASPTSHAMRPFSITCLLIQVLPDRIWLPGHEVLKRR